MDILKQNDYIEDWKEEMIKQACENLKQTGFLVPAALLLEDLGDKARMLIIPGLGGSKEVFTTAVKVLCRKKNILAMMFIAEAWAVKVETKEELESVSISDHPDKIEILHIIFETRLISKTTQFEINRIGKEIKLVQQDFPMPENVQGQFSNFMKDPLVLN